MAKSSWKLGAWTGPALALLGWAVWGWADLPPVRSMPELNDEAKIWVQHLEAVKASNQPVKVNLKDAGGKEKIRDLVGPYVPLEKISAVELNPDGTFSISFSKEHVIDLPAEDPKSDNKFIRVTVQSGRIKGQLVEAKTLKKGIPMKVLVFSEPQKMIIDPLNAKRESTVPGVAKMMGMLPKIIALVVHEGEKGVLCAPQLNGMGTSENPRLMKDLLFVDDTIIPDLTTKK